MEELKEPKKVQSMKILYSTYAVRFTQDEQSLAMALADIASGLSEADSLGYYMGALYKLARAIGVEIVEV